MVLTPRRRLCLGADTFFVTGWPLFRPTAMGYRTAISVEEESQSLHSNNSVKHYAMMTVHEKIFEYIIISFEHLPKSVPHNKMTVVQILDLIRY